MPDLDPTLPCSTASALVGEPLIGTAPTAAAWLCLEQPGPWGRTGFTGSHLDPELGARLEGAAGSAGVRPALIRRPGTHPDTHPAQRTVLLAATHPRDPWLLVGTVEDPGVLLDLDLHALARGDREAVLASLPTLRPDDTPLLLVCTNGRRDTCCARLGRPVALAGAAAHPGRVWEVTHTSGHRLAATTVLLPSGYLHGRVVDGSALLDSADRGRLELRGLRGRTTWPSAGQAAEDAVRRGAGIDGLGDVALVEQSDGGAWRVVAADGREWSVEVRSHVDDAERPESCGKLPKPVTSWQAGTPRALIFDS